MLLDFAAVGLDHPGSESGIAASCIPDPDISDWPRDDDGFLMTIKAAANIPAYMARYTYEQRQRKHEDLKGLVRAQLGNRERERKTYEPKKAAAKRFSTAYAIKWGRKQGWKLLDTEHYDFKNKRHHDLALGSDAMFESEDGIVYVQGAGRSEKKHHQERFEERGGIARAEHLRVRFVYLEFARESEDPTLVEWWVK